MEMRLKKPGIAGWILAFALSVGCVAAQDGPPPGDMSNPFVKPCIYKESLGARWRHSFHYMRTKWDTYFQVYPKELDGFEAVSFEKVRAEPTFYLEKNIQLDLYWGKQGSFYRPFTAPFHEVGYVNFGAWAYGNELWLKDMREQVHLLWYVDRRRKELVDKLNAIPMYTPVHVWAQVRSKSEGLPWLEIKGAEIIPETAPSESALRFLELGAKQMARKRYDLAAQSFDAALGLQLPVIIETRAFAMLGRAFYELRQFPDARNAYAESALRDDNNVTTLIYLARADSMLQNYDEMREAAERAVKIAPANPEARAELGLALAMLGDEKAGQRELDFAQKLAPRNQLPEANRNRAIIAIKNNKFEIAKQELSQAVILRASDPNLHVELGDVLLKLNQLDDAKREFGFAKELAPNRAEPYFKYAQIARTQGDALKKDNKLDDAKKLYTEALDNVRGGLKVAPEDEAARALELEMLKELGREKEAEKSIDTAIERWPNKIRYQSARYEVAVKLGKWETMEAAARKIVELQPEVSSYLRLANVLASKPRPDYKSAAENYEAALRIDPKSGSAWFELTQVKMNLGDVEGAIAASDKAVELVQSVEAKLLSARIRLDRATLDPAVATIAKLVLDEAKDDLVRAQANALLGASQLKEGNAGLAAETFARANPLLKDNAEFQYWYGKALLQKNDQEMAKAHFKSAVELARNAPTSSALMEKVAKEAGDEVEKMEPGYQAKLPEPSKSAVGSKDPLIRTPVVMPDKPVIKKVLPPMIEDDGPQLIPTEADRPK